VKGSPQAVNKRKVAAMTMLILCLLTPILAGAVAIWRKRQRSHVKRYMRKRQIIGEAAAAAVEALENELI
jgi:hypothetical protein